MKIFIIQCLFMVLLLSVLSCFSQTDTTTVQKSKKIISFSYQHGNVIKTTPFLKGENLIGRPIKQYQSVSVHMLWQNPGKIDWQKVFRAPYYGAGISLGDIYNPCELGYPVSIYGIFGIPVKRWDKLEIFSEFQFGVAMNWKYYDPLINPKNMNIGANYSFHLNVGMNAYYPISKKMDIGAGINFLHFSNGGLERPNKGLNIYGGRVELRYHLDNRITKRSIILPGRLDRSNDLYFMVSGSRFQLVEYELGSDYYGLGGFSLIYFTQLSNAVRLGYGADFDCWKLLNGLPADSQIKKEFKKSLGIILQPEIIVNKLSIVGGFGIYALHDKFGSLKQTYQRLGVRYEFYKNLSVGLNVRGRDFFRAEFMEFNMGYRYRWMK